MKRLARFVALNLLLLAVCLELAAFALSRSPTLHGRFFSMLPSFLLRLDAETGLAEQYASFVANTYDAELGWLPRPSSTRSGSACDGTPLEYQYDAAGVRQTRAAAAGRELLVFGDSFTHGDEVGDSDTYPWQLSELLERRVVNYGVGGYGPLQATLRFERVVGGHPDAEIAVLGVMSENIYRVVNAYRPVYHYQTQGLFTFKPSLREGELRPNANAPPAGTLAELMPRVRSAFASDFYSLPEAEFPYSLALLRGLSRPVAQLRWARRSDPLAGWHDVALQAAMRDTLERFVVASRARGIEPVIVWIPQTADLRNALRNVAGEFETAFAGRAALVTVAGDDDDWSRYAEPGCHPSRAGYGIIARHVADAVRAL